VIGSFLEARAEVVANGLGNPPIIDNLGDPAVASDTLTNGGVISTASAEATYGTLKAMGEISKGAAIEPFNFATGKAQFVDVVTVTGGTGAGTISFAFQLTGTLNDIAAGHSNATVEFDMFLPDDFQGHNQQYQVDSGNSRTLNELIVTPAFNIEFGVPFTIDTKLFARVQLEESDNGTATSNFLNTAQLTSVVVGGATGPATVLGISGTNYLIPEPSSLILLLVGGIACSKMIRLGVPRSC